MTSTYSPWRKRGKKPGLSDEYWLSVLTWRAKSSNFHYLPLNTPILVLGPDETPKRADSLVMVSYNVIRTVVLRMLYDTIACKELLKTQEERPFKTGK